MRQRRVWSASFVLALSASLAHGQVAVQPANAPAKASAPVALTLEQIMSDPDWIARSPERPYWSDDSSVVYFQQKRLGEEKRDLVRLDVATGESRVVKPEELAGVDVRSGGRSRDRSLKAYSRGGDLYLKDIKTAKTQQLTRTGDFESSPEFLVGDYRIAFQRGAQLYVRELPSGFEYQVADIRAENKPEEKKDKPDFLRDQQEHLFAIVKKNKTAREAAKKEDKLESQADTSRLARAWYLGDDKEIRETSLSPTGEHILVRMGKKGAKEGKSDSMPAFVTEDGYVSSRGVRTKVGTSSRNGDEVVLLDLKGRAWKEPEAPGKQEGSKEEKTPREEKAAKDAKVEKTEKPNDAVATTQPTVEKNDDATSLQGAKGDDGIFKLDLSVLPGIADDPLKEIREKAEALKPAPEAKSDGAQPGVRAETGDAKSEGEKKDAKKAEAGKPRNVSISEMAWSEDGSQVILHVFSHDNKDRWLAAVDLISKAVVPLEHFHDEAWINRGFSRFGWMRDNRTIWFCSEESGSSQVYFRDVIDGERWPLRPADPGEQAYEVVDVDLNLAGDVMYFVASLPGRPGVREGYRALIAQQFADRRRFKEVGSEVGFPVQQITTMGGQNSMIVSPDDTQALIVHSTMMTPPELYAQAIAGARSVGEAPARRLTFTVTPEFAQMDWVTPEALAIPGRDGRHIWSRVYDAGLPNWKTLSSSNGGAEKGRPAVVFIHGAGYLQNAHEGWSQYFREFMFHTLLARRGYVVLDMDYRASAGYGRDWRTAIYRQMGYPELDDLEDGVAYLVKEHGVDPKRIGCYGGSYGGFLTLMAMFTRQDLFVCGAALRPVTDWADYNDGYTANILNIPSVDPESYEKCSPIEHADGLKGHLLICHGMQDDNVLFQDTVRLTQRLIELKKENWEVAMYPIEPHAFKEATSWLDEYRRIDKLFRAHLGK